MTPFGEDVWAVAAGIGELSVDSAVVNMGLKFAARRRRPDRDSAGVPRRPEGADTSVGVLSIRAHPHPASPSRGAPNAAFSASKRVDSFGQVYRIRRLGSGEWPSQVRIEITASKTGCALRVVGQLIREPPSRSRC